MGYRFIQCELQCWHLKHTNTLTSHLRLSKMTNIFYWRHFHIFLSKQGLLLPKYSIVVRNLQCWSTAVVYPGRTFHKKQFPVTGFIQEKHVYIKIRVNLVWNTLHQRYWDVLRAKSKTYKCGRYVNNVIARSVINDGNPSTCKSFFMTAMRIYGSLNYTVIYMMFIFWTRRQCISKRIQPDRHYNIDVTAISK